ncbi:DUF1279 superfamily protein [Tilletia horrida]|nr:DUF1279 superfamily protein [Tilletia horrida]
MTSLQAPMRRAIIGRSLGAIGSSRARVLPLAVTAPSGARARSDAAASLPSTHPPAGARSISALCAPRFAALDSLAASRRWSKPVSSSSSTAIRAASSSASSSSSTGGGGPSAGSGPAPEQEDGPPKGASWRERFRFMTRRYGRWALVVYLLASAVDFSLVFAAIHFLGADHIKDLEARALALVGLQKQSVEESEKSVGREALDSLKNAASKVNLEANNEEAARAAADFLRSGGVHTTPDGQKTTDSSSGSSRPSWLSGTLGTELVLAYTIHKTALLPFRIAVTAAVLPSFVKLMVRLGWSRPNAAIQQAARAATEKASAAGAGAATAARKSV